MESMALVITNTYLLEHIFRSLEGRDVGALLRTCKLCELSVLGAFKAMGWNPYKTSLQFEVGGPHVPVASLAKSCRGTWRVQLDGDPRPAAAHHVTALSLHGGFESSDNSIPQDIGLVLGQLRRLRQLWLSRVHLGAEKASSVVAPLAGLTALTRLCLQKLDAEDIVTLAPGIHELAALEVFLLMSIRLKAEDLAIQGLAHGLVSGLAHCRHLKKFLLLGFGLPAPAELMRSLQVLTALTYLGLSGTCVGADGITALAPAFEALRQLQDLTLDGNDLGLQGAQCLAAVLPSVSTLTYLNLDENGLGVEGTRALAPALQRLRNLKQLWIKDNDLGREGVRALFHEWDNRNALTEINMKSNRVMSQSSMTLNLPISMSLGLPKWYSELERFSW